MVQLAGVFVVVVAAVLFVACANVRAPAAPPPGPPRAISAPSAAAADPATYQDPEGLFTVRLGGRAEVQVHREPLGAGEIVTTTASTSSDARLAMAMKLVISEVAAYDCAKGLAGMRDHTLANMGCSPTAENPTELRGRPGREILFTCTKRPMRGAMTIYCDDAQLLTSHRVTAYEVVAAYADSAWDEADARAILTSFTLR